MGHDFCARYGPWAVVAGGSEGLGAAFAEAIASRGLNLVLLANVEEPLIALAASLSAAHRVEVRTVTCDLADARFPHELAEKTRDIQVGLAVYNAAYSFVGPLLDRPLDHALRVIDVNCAGPVRLAHAVVPAMIARRQGGLVLMSSVAGLQGAPRLGAYAASKAFNIVLGESLWAELSPHGVDVIVSCAGAIRTPNYRKAAAKEAPGVLDAGVVANRTLDALGSGPRVVPGAVNKVAAFFLSRMVSRRTAVTIMGKSTRELS